MEKEELEIKPVSISIKTTISEMENEDIVDVPTKIDTKKLVKELGDKGPMFVILEAMNPQVSRNGWNWTPELMSNVAEQINSVMPDAYQGHLKEEDRGFKAPDAKTIWLGAIIKEIKGKPRLFIKGYVLPYAKKLKTYLKAAKILGKKVSVSVYGTGKQKWNEKIGAFDLSDFVLESIDWARPGAEGIRTSGYFALASEMKNSKKSVQEMEVIKEKEKEISNLEKQVGEMISEYIKSKVNNSVKSDVARKVIIRLVEAEMRDREKTKEEADRVIKEIMESNEAKELIEKTKPKFFSVNPAVNQRSDSGNRKYIVL